jgi:hypothetical protein
MNEVAQAAHIIPWSWFLWIERKSALNDGMAPSSQSEGHKRRAILIARVVLCMSTLCLNQFND